MPSLVDYELKRTAAELFKAAIPHELLVPYNVTIRMTLSQLALHTLAMRGCQIDRQLGLRQLRELITAMQSQKEDAVRRCDVLCTLVCRCIATLPEREFN